jgi:hypothetical protein
MMNVLIAFVTIILALVFATGFFLLFHQAMWWAHGLGKKKSKDFISHMEDTWTGD